MQTLEKTATSILHSRGVTIIIGRFISYSNFCKIQILAFIVHASPALTVFFFCFFLCVCAYNFIRLFNENFSHLGIDLEVVLSAMSRHPQYSCVDQIKEQLASDGQVPEGYIHEYWGEGGRGAYELRWC